MLANRNILIVAIAAFIGILAVIIANSYLSGAEKQQETAAEQGRLVQIAVARVPLEYGATLSAENIRMVSWPSTSMPAGAFQSPKGLYGGEARVVLRPIEVGEPILPGKITGFGGRASLSELLETDMRAVAVRINDVAGVAGFVLPGDRVDVLVTRTPKLDGEAGEVEPVTDILLQNVGVMAIDQTPSEKKPDEPSVAKTATLAVDQQGAQKLALAGQVGTISLALRNAANQDEFMSQTVGTRDLGQGNTRASLYAGPAGAQSATPAFAVNPFPYPTQSVATPRRGPVAVARPRPANSVGVEIVRGTTSTNYDVTRQGGY